MELKEIYRYTGMLYGVNLVSSFITFLVMIFITRVVSKGDLGIYGLFQAYIFISVYMSGLGVSSTIVKFVAQRHVDITQIHTLLACILAAMAVVLITAGTILIQQGREILGLALLTLPAYHVFDFSLSYARGHFWKNAEWLIILASSLATSIAIVLLLPWFPDYRGPIYGQVVSTYITAIGLLIIFFWSSRGLSERFAPIKGKWPKDFIYIAIPVFISTSLYSLNDVADRLIIEKYLGLEALGEYFFAMSLFNILDRPVALLARVLLSYFSTSNSRSSEPDKHIASVTKIIKINLLALPLFAFIVIAIVPVVLPFFLNKDYSQAFNILAIASTVIVVKSFELVNSMLVIARNSPTTNIYSQLAALIFYLPAAIVLIHLFGIFGIAVAVVLRWIVFSIYQFVHMRQMQIATISGWFLVRALAAYLFALSFFLKAPWAMAFIYLLAGRVLQLWSVKEFESLFRFCRPARLSGK
jgi:O-antigen/teichoic acid export membrane protein